MSDPGYVQGFDTRSSIPQSRMRKYLMMKKNKSDNQETGMIYVFVAAEGMVLLIFWKRLCNMYAIIIYIHTGATRTVTISDESKKNSQTAEDESKLLTAKIAHLNEQVFLPHLREQK